MFERDASGAWPGQATLLASDGNAEDEFAQALALSGDTAIVGARFNDDLGDNSGSAYVFNIDFDTIFSDGFEN